MLWTCDLWNKLWTKFLSTDFRNTARVNCADLFSRLSGMRKTYWLHVQPTSACRAGWHSRFQHVCFLSTTQISCACSTGHLRDGLQRLRIISITSHMEDQCLVETIEGPICSTNPSSLCQQLGLDSCDRQSDLHSSSEQHLVIALIQSIG